MSPFDWISLFLLLLIFYVVFLRQFIWKFRKFKCLRCGRCCSLRVKLTNEDIKRLKKSGKKNFVEKGNWLKRINGYCMFLEIKNGKANCTVYDSRPKICRGWPLKRFTCDTRCKSYYKK